MHGMTSRTVTFHLREIQTPLYTLAKKARFAHVRQIQAYCRTLPILSEPALKFHPRGPFPPIRLRFHSKRKRFSMLARRPGDTKPNVPLNRLTRTKAGCTLWQYRTWQNADILHTNCVHFLFGVSDLTSLMGESISLHRLYWCAVNLYKWQYNTKMAQHRDSVPS